MRTSMLRRLMVIELHHLCFIDAFSLSICREESDHVRPCERYAILWSLPKSCICTGRRERLHIAQPALSQQIASLTAPGRVLFPR